MRQRDLALAALLSIATTASAQAPALPAGWSSSAEHAVSSATA